ncbi:hypothetical protein L9F63_001736, partial [Diploptera punctata]
ENRVIGLLKHLQGDETDNATSHPKLELTNSLVAKMKEDTDDEDIAPKLQSRRKRIRATEEVKLTKNIL